MFPFVEGKFHEYLCFESTHRLSLGFGLVGGLLLIILGIGLTSLSRIQDGLTEVVDDRWPKMAAAPAILTHTDAIAIALRNMMLTKD